MKYFLIVMTLFTVGLIMACSDDDDASMRPAHEIWMSDTTFIPGQLSISSETTVIWVNNSSVIHTVTSADGIFDAFLNVGETFSYTFTIPGTYNYMCTFHQGMNGSVVVQQNVPAIK
jgi:plastocyanin